MENETTKLTAAQRWTLETMLDGRTSHSGRNGLPASTMKALAARGLVRQGKKHVWETDWHLTDQGRAVARGLRAAVRP